LSLAKRHRRLDRGAREELEQLREQVAQLRRERDKAQTVANSAESLLKAERTAQENLAEQIRQLESHNLSMKEDLSVFERLIQSANKPSGPIAVRGLQAKLEAPGRLHFQLMLMLNQRSGAGFSGRHEVVLTGTLGGKPWKYSPPSGMRAVQVKPYLRLDGALEYPAQAMVKTVQVTVTDPAGVVRATESLSL